MSSSRRASGSTSHSAIVRARMMLFFSTWPRDEW